MGKTSAWESEKRRRNPDAESASSPSISGMPFRITEMPPPRPRDRPAAGGRLRGARRDRQAPCRSAGGLFLGGILSNRIIRLGSI
ncbi:MAG: hypothetical protein J6Y92_02835 [Lentisphaeria bacterium]|nr:hypothetical protein [Lentisphaeria bacterium]